MRPLLLLSCLLAITPTFAENEKFPELKLKNGKTFSAVTVTKKTPAEIAIMHESGTARIPFEQLPDDVVKTLGGFDSEKAAEARKNMAQSEAAHRAEIDRELANQADAETAEKRRIEELKSARPAIIEVVQALEAGALCKVAWLKSETQYGSKKDSFGRDVKVPVEAVKSPVFDEAWIFVSGINAVDKDMAGISLILTGGNYIYENAAGARQTVRSYKTASKALPTAIAPAESYERSRYYTPSRRVPGTSMRRIGGG